MRKLPVVCAFALLLVNPCLSIAATTETTKISTFCRNELQKTSYDRLPWLGSELYSMISKGQVEPSIAQINKIIDIAVKSKNKSLSSDLERLLGDNLFWRQSEIARLIKVTPIAKRSLILAMLDNISKQIQSLDASYSNLKIQTFVQLANIYHSLNVKDKPSILLNQALQMSSGVRTTFNQAIQNANTLSDTKVRAVALTIIAREYNSLGQKQLGQQFLTQAIQTTKSVVTLSEKEKTEFTNLIYYILSETKQFEQALQVTTEIYKTQPNKANYSGFVFLGLQTGDYDFALKAVQLETNKNVKARGLINIASSQLMRQQESKAIETLAQAVLVAKTIPQDSVRKIEDTESRVSLLEEIALIYAQLGQDKEALQVAMVQDASEFNRIKQRISCY